MSNVTHVNFSHMAVRTPSIPSKYDIIPIHNSDRASFKFCRRQWAWSSPTRLNLIPKAAVHGVDKNLWFGTGIHYALQQYYNPIFKEDPVVAWETWFDIQWRGGLISEDELIQYADRNPHVDTGGLWRVDGLADILPDDRMNEEEFMALLDLGRGMMRYYKEYAEANDNFQVIAVEHDFSVPVLNGDGEPLYSIDTRLMPKGYEPNFDDGNEFGPYMRESGQSRHGHVPPFWLEKQVHVRGRMDLIIQEQEHGRYGIIDFKTASKIGEDYFRHLELDEQTTSYLTFGEVEARLHGLEYKPLEFIIYQAMLKHYPQPPQMLKNGLPSLNKSNPTTAQYFEKFIKDNGLEAIFNADEKMQSYYAYLLEMGDSLFIQRGTPDGILVWRNQMQRKNAMIRAYYEAVDMLSDPVCYPNPSKNYGCLNCRFRAPCIAAEDGSDYTAMLEDGYMSNYDR